MLPDFITAMKTYTYDTALIREEWGELSDEELIDLIDEWAREDFGSGFVLLDEDGREL